MVLSKGLIGISGIFIEINIGECVIISVGLLKKKPNKEANVQVCDATMFNSSTTVCLKKIKNYPKKKPLQLQGLLSLFISLKNYFFKASAIVLPISAGLATT
jgi:hypothetical protein